MDAVTGMSLKLLLTVVFVVLNGFFVAAEFALVKTRPSRVKALVAKGDRRAVRLALILEELDLYLSSCQLGITIASLVLGYLAEPAFVALFEIAARPFGIELSESATLHGVAFAVALGIVTILHMVFGEQAPKIWAIHSAERAALRFALPLRAFTLVFRPLITLINAMSNGLLRLTGVDGGHGEHDHDSRELKAIIGAAALAGNISARQRLFAENIIDLVALQVRHIMLARTEVASLDMGASFEANLARIRVEGHSRWPLVRGDLDDVVGIVLARDVLERLIAEREFGLEEIARAPLIVPDTQPLSRFIHESQQTGHQGALVVDEHGTVVGMAFLEDALEEIVGPMHDERDDDVGPTAPSTNPDEIEMLGSVDLPEASQRLGVDLGDTHDTIGGVIVAKLARLPRKGDSVQIEGYRAEVLRVGRGRRVLSVRFTLEDREDPEPETRS